MHLPSTRTLQAFVLTVRLGSLATASKHAGMSTPALSRRLAELEADLGVRLFERVPRGVVLTKAGEAYVVHARAVLERLQTAASDLLPDGTVVRVTTLPALATSWLLPRLPSFYARHPGIKVDVRTSCVYERLDMGGYDFAIRLAPDCQMTTKPLLPIHVMPVWSAAHPKRIEHPDDLVHHPLHGPELRPEFWQEWLDGKSSGVRSMRPVGMDALLLYSRILTGDGVAIGIEPFITSLLQKGSLAALKSYRLRSQRSFFLVGPSETRTHAGRMFRRWLYAEAGFQHDWT